MSQPPSSDRTKARFPVVLIGCSAGGLEPLGEFLAHAAECTQAVFFVVCHVPADGESHLVEILERHSKLPVEWACDKTSISQGKIFVSPPGKALEFSTTGVHLLPNRDSRSHPIDSSFESGASQFGPSVIAVVLSGAGSDGAHGARSVKEHGGLVLVQEPASAEFSSMPGHALLSAAADLVLPPQDLGRELCRLMSGQPVPPPDMYVDYPENDLNGVRRITAILKRHTGLDLSAYKVESVQRRIQRRMGIRRIAQMESYIPLLQRSQTEREALSKDMLISVTHFFRDPAVFQYLRTAVLPALVREAAGRPLRFWVPGCATGEEVYSIGILLEEVLRESGETNTLCKFFATDLDRAALDAAGQGIFPLSIVRNVPPDLLERYFTRQDGHFQICRAIRERIVFARHNLLKDPPFTRLDLVSCRNVLIYLQPTAQHRVLSILHYALRPEGVLVLGQSETLGDLQNDFSTVDSKHHVFRKKNTIPNLLPDALQFGLTLPTSAPFESQHPAMPLERPASRFAEVFTNRILSRLGRTCFVLSEQLDILYSFGNPSRYATLGEGRTSMRLTDLLPKRISVTLAGAAGKVLHEGKPFQYGPVSIVEESQSATVNISVEPFRNPGDDRPYLIVFIEEAESNPGMEASAFDLNESLRRVSELEDELRASKNRLKTAIEELEASNEELQTSNEELQASNEELQSTNEELESVNEELQTLNNEHQSKIAEITKANEDLDNFISSAGIATVFLDSEMRIRRFTPGAAQKTGLLAHDIGRSIGAFAAPLLAMAADAARRILAGETMVEQTLRDAQGITVLRSTPFIRKDGSHAGATVSFIHFNLRVLEAESGLPSEPEI